MQYIKIMFAAHYAHQELLRIDDIIQVASEDIFRYVDEFGKDEVYRRLEELMKQQNRSFQPNLRNMRTVPEMNIS